ncbi:hypothetical protein D9757_001698 [Collybiopsis confluens]|uniref:Uncharacterized protein n=1 Tax=Collybiopsis confluens TaxID=2823264 RepID=A0A8H5HYN2_9AGAR|nr:hypothetical protein D9757_001698 [Collybiopsis confluens]
MASMLRMYNLALQRRPMLTQCCTAAFLFGTGDIVAQQGVEGRGKKHDVSTTATIPSVQMLDARDFLRLMHRSFQFVRTARLTFYGVQQKGWSIGCAFEASSPKLQDRLRTAAVGFFFGSMSILEGKPREAIPRIQAAYVPTIVRNWGVFIPTQIVNFAIVPHHLRFVVVSVVSLFWNTYLSVANARQNNVELPAAAALELNKPTSVAELESVVDKKRK